MGELAMGVAHEIGNPLAGMKAVVQALQYEDDLPGPVLEPLRRLESEIDRLSGFLRSFHGFAAPTALDLRSVGLADALTDVLFWTRKEARSQQVEVTLRLPPDLPVLRADLPQLKQVLLNLVVNALHAMPDGGVLAISARADGPTVRIEVADSGCGIPADVLPRIFDPFFTTRPGGSGLGLAITGKIVREHGATINVDSQAGAGARFVLNWPTA
jgi:signal transduction histidine kinase